MTSREDRRQKRSLSQVFLHEDWPCRKMAHTLKEQGVREVLEIGPGPGILTRALLNEGFQVTSIEKDDRFAALLKEWEKEYPGRFHLVNADILNYPFEDWLKTGSGPRAICGNIPYNISTQIVFKVLNYRKAIRSAMLMVQLEFGERLASLPGRKSYGSLSVYGQLRANIKLEYMVPRSAFHPVPKVDSTVVLIEPSLLKTPVSDEILAQTEKITRLAFTQRRKKLSNSIATLLKDLDRKEIPIDLDRRAETLSPLEYMQLAKFCFGS